MQVVDRDYKPPAPEAAQKVNAAGTVLRRTFPVDVVGAAADASLLRNLRPNRWFNWQRFGKVAEIVIHQRLSYKFVISLHLRRDIQVVAVEHLHRVPGQLCHEKGVAAGQSPKAVCESLAQSRYVDPQRLAIVSSQVMTLNESGDRLEQRAVAQH